MSDTEHLNDTFRRTLAGAPRRRGGQRGRPRGRAAGLPGVASVLAAGAVAAPACGTDGADPELQEERAALSGDERTALVEDVRGLAAQSDVAPIPAAPDVGDELFELGQALMFDKELSGERDVSCMTCHPVEEPAFTSDDRHLSLGVGGVGSARERAGGRIHARNSLPLFNLHDLDVFFFDGRLEIDPTANGGHGQLESPADHELTPEMREVFEFGALSALGMFPVTDRVEMRGQRFKNQPNENELGDDLNFQGIWAGLMDRLGEIPEYVAMFEEAYPDTAFEDMTFAHASNAMAGFMIRGFESRGSPFQRFLEGDDSALSDSALRGAQDFFAPGNCATCHSGTMLTDEEFHNTGLAQFGPGSGDGPFNHDDFGRAAVNPPFSRNRRPDSSDGPDAECDDGHNPHDLYAFRPPSLHNVALTGPWGHTGQFSDLREFVAHYDDPEDALRHYDIDAQLLPGEESLGDMEVENTDAVVSCLSPSADVSVRDMDDMIAFLESLTDPGAFELEDVVPDEVPSGLPVDDGEAPEIPGDVEGTVEFADIARDVDSDLHAYRRAPSPRSEIADQLRRDSLRDPQSFPDIFDTPLRWRGLPGVAVLDYNGNGAMDIFVTNGPGAPNSLYENQMPETGELAFVDRAAEAGVAAVDTDSAGVCYGDINNNGYSDLYVVADQGRSHLFRNNGDGTFTDISDESGATPQGTGGTSCAFGDINGNGKLDLFVGRAWPQEDNHACFTEPFSPEIQHNELYINNGDGRFEDVSESSGIRELGGLPPFAEGAATITWSVALVDYNQNGHLDILHADDQCAFPNSGVGGLDRGFLQIFENDGTGDFTNRTVEAGTNVPSAWMGLSFGDFDSSGELDFFITSFGDWAKPFAGAPIRVGDETSRWYMGEPDGSFTDPGVGDLRHTPFGWGTSARDFDNDGAIDVVFHGGLDLWFFVDNSNPGSMLVNDGEANFGLDRGAFETDHSRRNVAGVAAGDLNGNGFQDIVSVSAFDMPEDLPLRRYGSEDVEVNFFSIFDDIAFIAPTFEMTDPSLPELDPGRVFPFQPTNKGERLFHSNEDITYPDGTLSVELNSADSDNNWVSVEVVGAVDLIPEGRVNRSGIGAVLTFTPEGGQAVRAPVLGGSSHLSQDSLIQGFGLGQAERGTVDILWPGGTKNRLYDVEHAERLRIPELPCSYDTSDDRATYAACVDGALAELSSADLADESLRSRMRSSAMRAYDEAR